MSQLQIWKRVSVFLKRADVRHYTASVADVDVWGNGGMMDGGMERYSEENLYQPHLSTTYPTHGLVWSSNPVSWMET
jgi:hypothetical protein